MFNFSYKFVVNIRWQRHTLWDDPRSVLYCNSTEPFKCSSFTKLEIKIKKLYYIIIFDERICFEQTSCCAAQHWQQQLKVYRAKSYLNRWGNFWSKLHQPCIPSVYTRIQLYSQLFPNKYICLTSSYTMCVITIELGALW